MFRVTNLWRHLGHVQSGRLRRDMHKRPISMVPANHMNPERSSEAPLCSLWFENFPGNKKRRSDLRLYAKVNALRDYELVRTPVPVSDRAGSIHPALVRA